MRIRNLLWAGLGVLFCSCSSDRSAGGTAETENAASARMFRVDSLLDEWSRLSGLPTVATLRLDAGNFPFDVSDPLGRGIDVRRSDGTSLPFEILFWDPHRSQARLRTRISRNDRGPGAALAVWRGLAGAKREDPAAVWLGIPDSQRVYLTSVLVDDFESGANRTRLPDSSSWFLSSNAGTGIAASGMGRPGKALRLVATSAKSEPVALAAALLADSPRSLRSVDSIVFWARGKGAARASLERAGAGTQVVAWRAFPLDSSWQRIRILPGEFDTLGRKGDGVLWSQVRDSATHLSFWMQGDGELWIDDPRIFGIDREDLR